MRMMVTMEVIQMKVMVMLGMFKKAVTSIMPMTTKAAPCSAQERPGCQAAEQRLQNSLSQVGQATGTPCNSKIISRTLKNF